MPRLRPSFTRRSAREGGPFSPTSLLALGVVERAALDAPDWKAALFRLEVPADASSRASTPARWTWLTQPRESSCFRGSPC